MNPVGSRAAAESNRFEQPGVDQAADLLGGTAQGPGRLVDLQQGLHLVGDGQQLHEPATLSRTLRAAALVCHQT